MPLQPLGRVGRLACVGGDLRGGGGWMCGGGSEQSHEWLCERMSMRAGAQTSACAGLQTSTCACASALCLRVRPVPAQSLGEYMSVLSHSPNNAFAANGVGAVLAELGKLDEAQVGGRGMGGAYARTFAKWGVCVYVCLCALVQVGVGGWVLVGRQVG